MSASGYAQLPRSLWTRPAVKRGLSTDGKLFLLYAMTGPGSNLLGLYYLPLSIASEETGIPRPELEALLSRELASFLEYEAETEEILVFETARLQIGAELAESDKRRKAAQRILLEAHSPRLVSKMLHLYNSWNLDAPSKSLRAPLDAPPKQGEGKGTGKEEGKEPGALAPGGSSGGNGENDDARRVFDYWRERRAELPNRREPKYTDDRKRKIRARLREGYSVADLRRAIDGMFASEFHMANGHLDVELACRSSAKVDHFLETADGNGHSPGPADRHDGLAELRAMEADAESLEQGP